MKKETLSLILVLVLALGIVASVDALTITWVDSDLIGPQHMVVRYTNGTVVGTYNTSAGIINLDPNASYIFQLRPIQTDYLRDPGGLLEGIIDWTSDHAVGLIFICFLGFVLLAARRR